ncbi:MAG: cupin domain-containing protein [Actinomycetota bacterium]|nr:cupin domain-containing protein [Actinomycetota bacterium]
MSGPRPPFEPTAVDLRDYVEFNLGGASTRRVFLTDVVAVDLVCLEPGQAVDARCFETADVVYTVVGGTAWVVTDDAEVTLRPLQALMVPAGVAHGLRNDSADPLIVQVVVSPPEEAAAAVHGPITTPSGKAGAGQGPGLLDRLRRTLGG